MLFKPLNDTVIIERDENIFTSSNSEVSRIASEGVIKLPDMNSLEKIAYTGQLVTWGDKCRYKADYEVGRKIMFKQFGGHKFEHDGKELWIFIEEELLAVYV